MSSRRSFCELIQWACTTWTRRVAGLMQPRLLEDGQVCVDMGPPTLAAGEVPTTLPATQDNGAAVGAELQVQKHDGFCKTRAKLFDRISIATALPTRDNGAAVGAELQVNKCLLCSAEHLSAYSGSKSGEGCGSTRMCLQTCGAGRSVGHSSSFLLTPLRVLSVQAAGKTWSVTCVSMGNPHAIVYSSSDGPVKVTTFIKRISARIF